MTVWNRFDLHRGWWAVRLAGLFLCILPAGCERATHPQPVSSGSQAPSITAVQQVQDWSPGETVRRVNEYRKAGKLHLIRGFIVPERRVAVIELIEAVDRLIAANANLAHVTVRKLGPEKARELDRSGFADVIGVFSVNVEVVDEKVEGDRAQVTIQIGKRLPLDRVDLERREGRWMIQTDPPIPAVADELEKLASVLTQFAERIDRGQSSTERVQTDLARREAPIARRLRELTDNSRPRP